MSRHPRLTSAESNLYVGVDVGGTKVAVLVAKDGEEIARSVAPTRLESPDSTLEGIAETVWAAIAQTPYELGEVAALGIGIPGRVDPQQGTVQVAVNLNLHNMVVGPALEQRLGVPCYLENDVRMATLGVKFHPNFAKVDSLAYLSIGTGIAAGIILNGELYRGANGMAGEIGHVEAVIDGPRCPCGAMGCLESVAAGPAIETMMSIAYSRQNHAHTQSDNYFTAGNLFQMAADGEPVARELVARVSQYLGWAVKLLVLSYDVELIVLGGGVTRSRRAFLDAVLNDITKRREESALAREMLKLDMIRLLPEDFEAPLWGGIALAQNGLGREEAIYTPKEVVAAHLLNL